jgi:hypothetical protein
MGKTCVSLCRLIAVEFAGSHKRSMSQKPSSMDIAGVEPRQPPRHSTPRHPQQWPRGRRREKFGVAACALAPRPMFILDELRSWGWSIFLPHFVDWLKL